MKYLIILAIFFNLSYATTNYFEEAGEYYKIDPKILYCIAKKMKGDDNLAEGIEELTELVPEEIPYENQLESNLS